MILFLSFISEIIIYHSGNFIYRLDTDKSTASLVGHIEEKMDSLEIPSTVSTSKGQFEVNEIGPSVFKDDHSINGPVSIPENIEIISENAFYNSSITSINFASGCKLTKIGHHAFAYCNNISSKIIFPESLLRIDRSAFINCIKIPSVKFNSALESILVECFQNCYGLTGTLVLPPRLITLEIFAFKNCYQLTNVDFGSNPNLAIYKPAFDGCPDIQKFKISDNNNYKTSDQGAFFRYLFNQWTLMNVPKSITNLVIDYDLKDIDDNALKYSTSLNSVKFTVQPTFFQIDSLGQLIKSGTIETLYFVPRNATTFHGSKLLSLIKPFAFTGCNKLTSFTVEDGNVDLSVENGALKLQNRLVAVSRDATEFTYTEKITSHVSDPFNGCTKLKNFKVDSNNQYIYVEKETNALYNFGNRSLLRVPPAYSDDLTLLDSVAYIDHFAFQNVPNIKSISVGNNIRSVEALEFIDTNNLIVYVPSIYTIFNNLPFIHIQVKTKIRNVFNNFITLKNNNTLMLILIGVGVLTALNVIIVVFIIIKKRQGNISLNSSPLLHTQLNN